MYIYIYVYIYIYIYIYFDKDKEIITTEFTTYRFALLRSSGKYEWYTVLNIDGMQVLKLNNLIINLCFVVG